MLFIRTGISAGIPGPEYRILRELPVLQLIADRNVFLVATTAHCVHVIERCPYCVSEQV